MCEGCDRAKGGYSEASRTPVRILFVRVYHCAASMPTHTAKRRAPRFRTRAGLRRFVRAHTAVVFTKSYCPYCVTALKLLRAHTTDVRVVELDTVPNGEALGALVREETGRATVPNVFLRGAPLGGCDDVQAVVAKGWGKHGHGRK